MIERLNAALVEHYRIVEKVGKGGMATVFLADDLRHHRKVALKVLRPELAAVVGAERFLAEIETTAGLQHPHILPLFDSGEAAGFLFFVMPYISGETLRDKLDREKQLPVGEAVRIATAVASALSAAHEKGVIHRDIKPSNILLSRGEPLVSDFGIAIAVTSSGGARLTETGLSVGTPYYMSPEQAAGDRAVTAGSDIYALGCVLYEMLVGKPPHLGASAQAVLGKILTEEPQSPALLRAAVPENVAAAVLTALEKLPADRFTSASGFIQALNDAGFRHRGGSTVPVEAGTEPGPWKRIALAALGGVGIMAAVLVLSLIQPPEEGGRVVRQKVILGSGVEMIPGIVSARTALAPDGSGVLFADSVGTGGSGPYSYWWKSEGEADARRVPNMDGAEAPVFSPNGQWVAYFLGQQLRKQPLQGGRVVVLADSVNPLGEKALTWLLDGTLVFEGDDYQLERIHEDGSSREVISTPDVTGLPTHLSGLRDGSGFLVTSCFDTSCASNTVFLFDLKSNSARALAEDVVGAWHVTDDRIVYVDRQGGVFSSRLDRSGIAMDPPVPLFGGVATSERVAEMEIAANGSVLFLRGPATSDRSLVVWVDRNGAVEPVDPAWAAADFRTLALSPRDDRLVVAVVTGGMQALWVKNLPDGPLTRLTVGPGSALRPIWTSDGSSIAYVTGGGVRNLALTVRSDGSSRAPDTLLRWADGHIHQIEGPDPQGRLLFTAGTGGQSHDVGYLDAGEDQARVWLLTSGSEETSITLSPDGQWVAYVSNLSGRNEVYVRPFPQTGARRVQVSTNGGTEPLWSHGGREIFYRDGDGEMTIARMVKAPELGVEGRERLFSAGGYRTGENHRAYDVTEDDNRFVMLRQAPTAADNETVPPSLILITNWFRELLEAVGHR